ncbi:MAG: aspartyl protease family protein [Amphiplicatus sp.]
MRLVPAIAVIVLLSAAPLAGRAEPVAAAPYRIDYFGWFAVPVMVNGEGPYDFIVDTGATRSLVFENLAAAKGFAPSGGPPQTVLGLLSEGRLPAYFVGDLSIGAARLDALATVILGDWKTRGRSPQGVLGLDFLTRYFVVFDAETRMMRLYAPGSDEPDLDGFARVRMRRDTFGLTAGDLFTVAGEIGQRRVPFLLDLGASGTVVNPAAARSLVRRDASPLRMGARVTDALDETGRAQAIILDRFSIGRALWRDQHMIVHATPVFIDLGKEDQQFGLFGADLVYERSFAFDFDKDRFYIGPPRKR